MDDLCEQIILELIQKIENNETINELSNANNFTVTQEFQRIKQIENLKTKVSKRHYELMNEEELIQNYEYNIKRKLIKRSEKQQLPSIYEKGENSDSDNDIENQKFNLPKSKIRLGLSKYRSFDQSEKWRKSIISEYHQEEND